MRVKDVMTANVQTCPPDTNLSRAAAMMWEGDCGILPVVEDGILAGIVTDRDICIALGTQDRLPHTVPVRDVETTDVATCEPEDDLRHALELMRRYKVRRLPVTDTDHHLKGIVSLNDIVLRADRAHPEELSYDEVVNTMKAVCEHRPESVREMSLAAVG
jgi:CBS domain-containing protein